MQCYTCNLSPICKIFQTVNDAKVVATVSISSCKLYQGDQQAPFVQPVGNSSSESPVRPQRTPAQLAKMNELIRQKQFEMDKANSDVSLPSVENMENPQATAVAEETCKNCGHTTIIILSCSACNKPICDGCSTEDVTNGKIYCEPCWDAM